MASKPSQRKAEAAWKRIESLGGHGVWDADNVIVSLADTDVTDDDLALFQDFPFVQTLDLSRTKITDKGLAHLVGLAELTELCLVSTRIKKSAIKKYQQDRPGVVVTTEPPPAGSVNPFTGEPM